VRGNALRSIKTGSHYDFIFIFFSLTYVPRSFPLHINLSPQWDPTDFCAICCTLPLLQVLCTSANQVTTIPVVNKQNVYKCQWSVVRFCYIWHNTGYSGICFAIFLSPCMELPIYELMLAHDYFFFLSLFIPAACIETILL
jgi:hypothetical protein